MDGSTSLSGVPNLVEQLNKLNDQVRRRQSKLHRLQTQQGSIESKQSSELSGAELAGEQPPCSQPASVTPGQAQATVYYDHDVQIFLDGLKRFATACGVTTIRDTTPLENDQEEGTLLTLRFRRADGTEVTREVHPDPATSTTRMDPLNTGYIQLRKKLGEIQGMCGEVSDQFLRSGNVGSIVTLQRALEELNDAQSKVPETPTPERGDLNIVSLLPQITELHKVNVIQVDNKRYRIVKKVGEGSFCVVFQGEELAGGGLVAIKFELRGCDHPQLQNEYRAYKALQGCRGIPRVHYVGSLLFHSILIIDCLGPSLEDFFNKRGRTLPLETLVPLAKQMLHIIKDVHSRGWINGDIKPDNFLFGIPRTPSADIIHIIDFGIAKMCWDPKNKHDIPYGEGRSLSGTARYMSINTHLGREKSRRDDLEALAYVWLYFLRGRLPWQGIKGANRNTKQERIGTKKQRTTVEDLCMGFPEFAEILTYIRNLGFEDNPDYEHLQSLLTQAGRNTDGSGLGMVLAGGKGIEVEHLAKKRPRTDSVPDPGAARARMMTSSRTARETRCLGGEDVAIGGLVRSAGGKNGSERGK